jgi:hypothetical protein
MLASVSTNFNYILNVLKYCEKIIIYFWTFSKFIGNVSNNAIAQQQQFFKYSNSSRI